MSGPERFGAVLLGAGLALFVAAVVAVRVGALDALLAAAAPGAGTVVLVALAAAAVAARGGPAAAGGRASCGYTARGEREMHRHEQGHVNACRRAGGGRSTYRVWRNRDGSWSGLTTHHDWRRVARLPVEKQIAILAAGVAAAPSTGSPTDEPHISELLADLPAGQRAAAERRGRQLGRRWAR